MAQVYWADDLANSKNDVWRRNGAPVKPKLKRMNGMRDVLAKMEILQKIDAGEKVTQHELTVVRMTSPDLYDKMLNFSEGTRKGRLSDAAARETKAFHEINDEVAEQLALLSAMVEQKKTQKEEETKQEEDKHNEIVGSIDKKYKAWNQKIERRQKQKEVKNPLSPVRSQKQKKTKKRKKRNLNQIVLAEGQIPGRATVPLKQVDDEHSISFSDRAVSIAENQLFEEYHIDTAHNGFDEYGYFDDDAGQVAVMDPQMGYTYGHSTIGVQSFNYGRFEMYDVLVLGSVVLLGLVMAVCMLACCTSFIIMGYVGWKQMRFAQKKSDTLPLDMDELV